VQVSREVAAMQHEFEWFEELLQQRLGPLQRERKDASLDLNHVLIEAQPGDVHQLTDHALVRALEKYRNVQGEPGQHIRALVRAEQRRRDGRLARLAIVIATLSLIVSIAAAALGRS
jgi:hypothetical protein